VVKDGDMAIRKEVAAYVKQQRRGARCPGCGKNASQSGRPLHYHHIDPSRKAFEISKASGKTLDEVKEEIDKCVLICYQCHRRMHEAGGHAIAVVHGVGGYAHLDIIGSPE
jgi:hypothetical protein